MSLASSLNRAVARARDEAVGEDALVDAYAAELRRAGRESARRFTALVTGTPLVAAADWNPPTVAAVTAWAISAARIRAAQRGMMAAIGGTLSGVPGVDFGLTQPVVQRLLDQVAVRAEDFIREGVRSPVAVAITRSWAEGRSVPDTARAIRAAVANVVPYKSVALARTDLIGLSNGGGQWAVEQLNRGAEKNGEPKPIQSKTWTTAGDSRVRETHQDADGQTVPINEKYRVGGSSLAYPGDPSGPHEEVVQCRCVEIFNEEKMVSTAKPAVTEPGRFATAGREDPAARLFLGQPVRADETGDEIIVGLDKLARLFRRERTEGVLRRAASGPPVYPERDPSRRNP